MPSIVQAAKKKDLEKVLKLLEGGADPNEKNAKGSVPLMDAAWNRSTDIADALIKCKADVNVQNLRGNTALHFAFERNSKPMVALLLHNGAAYDYCPPPTRLPPHPIPLQHSALQLFVSNFSVVVLLGRR